MEAVVHSYSSSLLFLLYPSVTGTVFGMFVLDHMFGEIMNGGINKVRGLDKITVKLHLSGIETTKKFQLP